MKTLTDSDVERFVYLLNLCDKLFSLAQQFVKDKPICNIFISAYMANIEECKTLAKKLGIK